MTRGVLRSLIALLGLVSLTAPGRAEPLSPPAKPPDWALLVYSTVNVEIDMVLVPFHLDKTRPEYRLVVLSLARRLNLELGPIGFEVEGQVGKHIAGNDHWEFNAAWVSRWRPFPWDRDLDTSFAFGFGLSHASRVPHWEATHFRRTSRTLAFLVWELDFAVPRWPRWSLCARLHHRSGMYGTFHGVYAGTNAVGLGIKHLF